MVAVCVASASASGQPPPGSLSTPLKGDESREVQPLAPDAARAIQTGPREGAQAVDFEEQIPPVGRGNLLSEAQVRYCLAESVRIEAVRAVLDKTEPEGVEEFNVRALDFNSRCGSYRYIESEIFFARRDVEDQRARLQAEAREAYLKRAAARKASRARAPETALPPRAARDTTKDLPQPAPSRSEPSEAATRPETKLPEGRPAPAEAVQAAVPSVAGRPPASVPTPEARRAPSEPPPKEPISALATQPAPTTTAPAPKPPEPPARPTAPAPKPAEPASVSPAPAREGPISAPAAEPSAGATPPVPQPREPALPPPPAATAKAPPSERAEQPPARPTVQPGSKPADRPAVSPATDAVLSRYTRDIQRTGSRVLDERQYPGAAKGKGWTGTAQIEVRFAEGGFIRSIVLGESSGYPALDARALEIARTIMFPHMPKELYAREFAVRFPIAFKPRKSR